MKPKASLSNEERERLIDDKFYEYWDSLNDLKGFTYNSIFKAGFLAGSKKFEMKGKRALKINRKK